MICASPVCVCGISQNDLLYYINVSVASAERNFGKLKKSNHSYKTSDVLVTFFKLIYLLLVEAIHLTSKLKLTT